MPRSVCSYNYKDVSSDASVNSTASSRQAKAAQQKIQKIPVGTSVGTTPLESINVLPVVPKKVPQHPPVHHICPPDLGKAILNTMPPAPDVATTMPSASDVVPITKPPSLAPDVVTTTAPMPSPYGSVDPVDLASTRTYASSLVDHVDLVPTMPSTSGLVEPVDLVPYITSCIWFS